MRVRGGEARPASCLRPLLGPRAGPFPCPPSPHRKLLGLCIRTQVSTKCCKQHLHQEKFERPWEAGMVPRSGPGQEEEAPGGPTLASCHSTHGRVNVVQNSLAISTSAWSSAWTTTLYP